MAQRISGKDYARKTTEKQGIKAHSKDQHRMCQNFLLRRKTVPAFCLRVFLTPQIRSIPSERPRYGGGEWETVMPRGRRLRANSVQIAGRNAKPLHGPAVEDWGVGKLQETNTDDVVV